MSYIFGIHKESPKSYPAMGVKLRADWYVELEGGPSLLVAWIVNELITKIQAFLDTVEPRKMGILQVNQELRANPLGQLG